MNDDAGSSGTLAPDPWAAEKSGQSILPGMRGAVGHMPRDYRPWRNQAGVQIDSPAFRGPEFFGKIIPPVTEPDGSDVRAGDFQVMRTASGDLVVVDWSLPLDQRSARSDGDEDLGFRATPGIMGRTVYRTRAGLVRAKNAMNVLYRDRRDRQTGLPPDPAVLRDSRKKEIRKGSLSLCRFARGPYKGRFCIVDENVRLCERGRFEVLALGPRDMKRALAVFAERCKERSKKAAAAAASRVVARGAPIAFSAPSGFGSRANATREDVLGPSCPAWKTTVAMYARTGRWCRTAELVWGEVLPPALVTAALEARERHLAGHGS